MIVYTMPKLVTDLQPGDIVISGGQAKHLTQLRARMLGYHIWAYTRHITDQTTVTGRMHLRADSWVDVLCVTLDGSALVGSAEVTS